MLKSLLQKGKKQIDKSIVGNKHICFVTHNHRIISMEVNTYDRNTFKSGMVTNHAEENAIRKARNKLSNERQSYEICA